MSLDQAVGRRPAEDQSHKSSNVEPKEWQATGDDGVLLSKPSRTATATFDFSQGGPSDWERFSTDPDDELYDVDTYSREKVPSSVQTPPHPETAELPSVPSPSRIKRKDSETTGVSAMDDEWPTSPSVPAPLNIRRPVSTYAPTPPEATKSSPPATNSFIVDDGGWIPPRASVNVTTELGHAPKITTKPDNVAANPRTVLERESASPSPYSNEDGRHPSNSGFIMPSQGLVQPPRSDESLEMHSKQPQAVQTPYKNYTPGDYTPNEEPNTAQGILREAGLPKSSNTVSEESAISQAVDIAPGLDPWYKTSLQRYLGMLYCEAAAESVEEKHRIFIDFMADEAHARGIEQSLKTTVTARNVPTTTNTTSEEKLPPETPKLSSMSKTDPHMDADTDGEEYSPGGRPKLVHAETASHLNNKSTESQTQTQLLVARKSHDQQVEAFFILWMTQCLGRARSIAYMFYMLI